MPCTLGSWLETASAQLADFETPRLDAEILLCQALDLNRTTVYAWPDKAIDHAAEQQLQQLLIRRLSGEPIAYIVGSQEFYGLPFCVNEAVLVPRPETEQLVDLVLTDLHSNPDAFVLDAGTGSGAIAVAIAYEAQKTNQHFIMIASDESESALLTAHKNVQTHTPQSVALVRSNWLSAFANDSFDIVVSNPPYITDDDPHLKSLPLTHEPLQALASGHDGLHAIREIIADAVRVLKPNGRLLIEHGYEQAHAIRDLLLAYNYQQITTHSDLAGLDRICTGIKSPH